MPLILCGTDPPRSKAVIKVTRVEGIGWLELYGSIPSRIHADRCKCALGRDCGGVDVEVEASSVAFEAPP